MYVWVCGLCGGVAVCGCVAVCGAVCGCECVCLMVTIIEHFKILNVFCGHSVLCNLQNL
jgi:hypothetical protein